MMKKKLLVIGFGLTLLLVGCGSTGEEASGATSAGTTSQNSQSSEENFFKTPDFAVSQIPEYPVEVQGLYWETQKTPNSFELFMLDYEVDEITENSIIAHGVLTNEVLCTEETITVTYSMTRSDESAYFITGCDISEETVILAPAIPCDMEVLYNCEVEIYQEQGGREPIATLDNYTIELDPNGWRDNFTYDDYIYFTDSDGNRYRTFNEESFYFTGTGSDWSNSKWRISSENQYFAVKLIEE